MKNTQLINRIIQHQSKLISKEWSERTKHNLTVVKKMRKQQQSLSKEEVYKEAMEQSLKIRNQRLKNT